MKMKKKANIQTEQNVQIKIVNEQISDINIVNLIKNNDLCALESFLKTNKFNPNQRDNAGDSCSWTPLYWSVKLNKLEIVQLLIANGADINMVINDPFECYGTALDLATLLGHEEIENLMRKHIINDNEGKSAYKAIRTKLRSSNTHAFNFKSARRQAAEGVTALIK